MTVVAFDTLAFANKLKGAGMNPSLADVQAEETAKILTDLTANQLATKQDLKDIELKIVKWMIGLMVAQTGILLSIIHFIK